MNNALDEFERLNRTYSLEEGAILLGMDKNILKKDLGIRLTCLEEFKNENRFTFNQLAFYWANAHWYSDGKYNQREKEGKNPLIRLEVGKVYFAEATEVRKVKISFSTNVDRRMAKINSDSPTPVRLIGAIIGTRLYENALHRQFCETHAYGDWFKQTPKLMKEISRLLQYESTRKRICLKTSLFV